MPVTRPILWDIYEEHLDESAWLWGEWESSLDSALYAITDVAIGPEERLLAHLDGLVLGGKPVAEKLLVPALASDDPGLAAAASWALLQAEDADHQDKVIEALAAGVPGAPAIGRALALSPRADISRLIPLWQSAAPELRALIIDVFTPREPEWVRQQIGPALRAGNPVVTSAVLRAIRSLRDQQFRDHVQAAMRIDDAHVLHLALSAGLCLGLKGSWDACRAAANKSDAGRFPLGLLATSPDPNDRAIVRSKIAVAEIAEHALWALGFSGEVEAADVIVTSLEKSPKIAGEALSAITGLVVDGPFRKAGETHGPDEEEVGLDDPPPVVRSEDDLPEPAAGAIKAWWGKERARFKPGVRYLYGQPRSPQTLQAALIAAPTWRRDILALELACSKAPPLKLDLKTWAKDQLKVLGPA
jgi:uncharacterized protein (TIGR02270 family)